MIAFNEKSYGEIILHPPPLSYLCIILLPFLGNKEKMKRVTKMFSLLMFWIENAFFVTGFFFFEIVLLPFAYLRTTLNLFHVIDAGFLRKIGLFICWVILGLPLDIYLVYKDLTYFLKILG